MPREIAKTSTQGGSTAKESPSARGASSAMPNKSRPTVHYGGPSTKADFNRSKSQ